MTTARRPRARAPEEAPALSEPATRVLRRFRLVFNTVRAQFREVEKKAGIAGAQVWALSVIRDNPGIGVGGLARAMDVHQSTASNLLKPLVEQEFVVSDRVHDDKRAVHLRLTPAGTRLLRKARGPFNPVLPKALAALDERTLARLDRDLGELVALLGGDGKSARLPMDREERCPAAGAPAAHEKKCPG